MFEEAPTRQVELFYCRDSPRAGFLIFIKRGEKGGRKVGGNFSFLSR